MTGTRALDRFGFPVRWAIDFRRARHAFGQVTSALSPADRIGLDAARLLLDGDARGAVDLLAGRPTESFRDLFNLATAYELLGDAAAGKAFDAARAADGDRLAALAARRTTREANLVLPFPVTTGGMRVQVDLARALVDFGYEVTVVQVRGDDARDVPGADAFRDVVSVSGHPELTDRLRASPAALTVVGCWVDYLPALRAGNSAVVGFSGGEPTLNESDGFDEDFLTYRLDAHRLPVGLMTCSRFIQDIYRDVFGRVSDYVPAAIDDRAFDTGPRPADRPFRVLLMAWDGIGDKGLAFAVPALENLRRRGLDLEIVWITPHAPEVFVDLDCELHVDPPRARLFEVLRSCHALVYPPLVDGLGLPPVEAMAAGVPVVVTESGGSAEFAAPEVNCVVVEKGSVAAIEHAVERLYRDPALARELADGGRREAERYRPSRSRSQLRQVLAADRPIVCTDIA